VSDLVYLVSPVFKVVSWRDASNNEVRSVAWRLWKKHCLQQNHFSMALLKSTLATTLQQTREQGNSSLWTAGDLPNRYLSCHAIFLPAEREEALRDVPERDCSRPINRLSKTRSVILLPFVSPCPCAQTIYCWLSLKTKIIQENKLWPVIWLSFH